MKEKIINIKEILHFKIAPVKKNNNKTPGMSNIIDVLSGYEQFDGYEIETDKQKYYVLIENGQSCCESWGYISSNDDIEYYIVKNLVKIGRASCRERESING